ncbi:DUF5668 domain-containing protein [Clostridium carnis]
MKKNISPIIWGIAIILFGIATIGNALGLWRVELFDGWWTLFFIIPAIVSMISEGISIGNIIFLLIGVGLFIEIRDLFPNINVWGVLVGIVVVSIGLNIIFGKCNTKSKNRTLSKEEREDINERIRENCSINGDVNDSPAYFTAFGGIETRNISQNLYQGSATAIFGGVELDLSQAKVVDNCNFNCTAIFGGVDIIVPRNTRVIVKYTPIFGGIDNNAPINEDLNAATMTINCVCIFGGIDIN